MSSSNPFPTKTRARFAPSRPAPASKRAKEAKEADDEYELIAPSPTLQGLPDDVLLYIMSYLSIHSLFCLSLACRRFLLLSRDRSVWKDVEMTKESFGRKIDLQKMKKFIRERLSSAVTRVMVEEMFPSKAVVNEALLDLLFNTCPKLRIIVVVRSDFSKISGNCLLFKSSLLRHVSLKRCSMKMNWLSSASPSWPRLQSLSLSGSSMTNNKDLAYIATNKRWKKSLRYLNLTCCYRLSLGAIAQTCIRLPALRLLQISEAHHKLEELQQKLQELNFARSSLLIQSIPT